MKFLINIVAVMLTALLIGGCSSDSDGNSVTSVTGNFVDDPVSGLIYDCSSGTSGVTDASGAYTCENGDTVTFSIGAVVIGTVDAEDGIVTPYSFFPGNNEAALNLARLLQSVDTDPSDDVIILDPAQVALLDVATSFASPTFVNDVQDDLNITLVSVQDAQTQLNETIATAGGDIPDGANIPVADAGVDQTVITGVTVILDGSGSSDADGDLLDYNWSIATKPATSSASLTGATDENSSFQADKDGTYEIQLVVFDGDIYSAADTVVVTAATANTAPVANAGADQAVTTGTLVTLDGSGSSDVDSDPLTYLWSVTSGSATLSSTTAQNPTFTPASDGTYEISLVVNDGTVDSDNTDTVTVTATSVVPGIVHNGTSYGTVTSPKTGKVWLDRNLGATQVCTSSYDTACFGDYYQWGRNYDGHQSSVTTTSVQASDVMNVGHGNFITSTASNQYDWAFGADTDGSTRQSSWLVADGSSVCPAGYRVPTYLEMENETDGVIYDDWSAMNNFLKLPLSGARSAVDGTMSQQSSSGYLWTSFSASLSGYPYYAFSLYYYNLDSDVSADVSRGTGIAVRCIKN